MKLEFIGAAHEVTGSCHHLEIDGKHILIDCGMEQGADLYENQDLPVNAAEVDYVLVTHAHIDHSGLLPLLHSRGFRGKVYATKATTELCNIMLKDSAHIQEFEAEWKNRKARRAGKAQVEPMYTMADAEGVLTHFIPCPYDAMIEVDDGLRIRFVDAGHLLGSASIEVWGRENGEEVKLVFSGDIGNGRRPLIKDPTYLKEADYVVMESTYGNKLRETPPDYAVALAQVLKETFAKRGNVVIPAFSVGRTQEMLFFLRRIKAEHMLPEYENFITYIDSPLAVEATNIFHRNVSECFGEAAMELVNQGINPIQFPGLRTSVTSDESKAINFEKEPVVIISASGMCEAGRIRHHLKHNLWRAESTIVFVGYQVPGTLGAHLLGGAKEVKLFGEVIEVRARIERLPGISGHADQEHLLRWIGAFEKKPKRVFVVHGEDKVTEEFASLVTQKVGLDAVAPYSGELYDLMTNVCVKGGNRELKPKHKKQEWTVSTVFTRLLAAGERLLRVIRKNEGVANKDLAKFADQINSLCDKWDR